MYLLKQSRSIKTLFLINFALLSNLILQGFGLALELDKDEEQIKKNSNSIKESFVESQGSGNEEVICARLVGDEKSLCLKSSETLSAIKAIGIRLGLSECQTQFRWHRWNCSTLGNGNGNENNYRGGWSGGSGGFGAFLGLGQKGTKESAYIEAITSAGLTYSIAKGCSTGGIQNCGCAPPTTISTVKRKSGQDSNAEMIETSWEAISSVGSSVGGGGQGGLEAIEAEGSKSIIKQYWRWGGCSADVDFAVKLSRKVLDLDIGNNNPNGRRISMRLHNNKAGRKIVQGTLETDCKCHGVSGSCTLKTCWLKLPPFRRIGERLMRQYEKAVQATPIQRNHSSLNSLIKKQKKWNKNSSFPILILSPTRQGRLRMPKKTDLVYLDNSSNYCEPDGDLNSLGTHRRPCLNLKKNSSSNTNAQGGCDILCCGRGYSTHQIWRRWKCHCNFKWCCIVECQDCQERVEIYTCN